MNLIQLFTCMQENNHVAIGVTVDLMGYELTFVSNATVSTEVPVPVSELECPSTCQNMQSKANFQSIPFHIYIAGKNRFGIGQNTSCTESGDKIGELVREISHDSRHYAHVCIIYKLNFHSCD